MSRSLDYVLYKEQGHPKLLGIPLHNTDMDGRHKPLGKMPKF